MAKNRFSFGLGYIGSATALLFTRGANYLAKGSRNWLITGLNKLVGYKGPLLLNGVEGGKQMMQADEGYASLGTATTAGLGSVFRVLTALFFIGAGAVRYNGTAIGAVATSTLSLRLLENGAYAGTTLQAGLAQPSAPTIFTRAAGPGFSGTKLIPGTRAILLHRIRSTTGAVSIASLPSNVVITTTGQTIVITAPLPSSNGDDRWGVDVPKAGLGEFGPFYILIEIPESDFKTTTHADGAITAADATLTSATAAFVAGDIGRAVVVNGAGVAGADLTTTIASINSPTSVELTAVASTTVAGATYRYGAIVDGVSRSIELEWTDGQLAGAPFAPIDDFPPPAALFGGTLNDTGFLDGCYGDVGSGAAPATLGATIVTSLPLKFESWPPDNLIYTPQPPTAVSSRAADGYAYRAGKSTLGAMVYTGGDPPITYQLRWPNAGCLAPHNMAIAGDGRLYIFTAQAGLARIGEGDEPDTEWATPFSEDTIGWNPAEVVMGEDGRAESGNNAPDAFVCACHRKVVLPFNRIIDRACTPCDLTGKIRGNIIAAANSPNGELYLCTNNAHSDDGVTTTNASPNISVLVEGLFQPDDIGATVILTEPSPGVGTLTTTILSITNIVGAQLVTLANNVTWTSTNTTIDIDPVLRLYRFNAGTGMVSEAYSPWIGAEDEADHVYGVGGAVTVDNTANKVVVRLLANGNVANVAREWQVPMPKTGFRHIYTQQPNLINAKSHALYAKVTGTGGETGLDSLYSESEPDPMVIG